MLVLFAREGELARHLAHDAVARRVPLLLAAALVNLASIVVKGVRWWVFLRPIGATSLPLALRATFAGAGLNNVLVANGGEAARVVFVARARTSRAPRCSRRSRSSGCSSSVGYVIAALARRDLPRSFPPARAGEAVRHRRARR